MLKEDLKDLISGDVTDEQKELDFHSRDTSLFKLEPQVVVYPKDSSDISKLVKYASEHEGVSLTARAGGTDMTGGPLSESVVMNFTKYLNNFSVKIGRAHV